MNELQPLRSVALWVVPFAIVLAILGWETGWGDGVSLPVPVAAPSAPKPVDVVLMPEFKIDGGLAARKETVERVLFNATRRPAPPANEAAGGNGAMHKGKYTLTGTTVTGNVATAFLRETAGGKSYALHKSEKLDGMTITEITPESVKLTQGGDTEELHLKIAVGPKTTVQAPLASAPPSGVAAMQGVAAREVRAAERAEAARAFSSAPRRAGAVPGAAQPAQAGVVSVGELLAERRRAAAAAAAAGGSAAPAGSPNQGYGQPQ